jgi:hypothetical protein
MATLLVNPPVRKSGLSALVGVLTSMPPRERADAIWMLVEDESLLEELFEDDRQQKEARLRERPPVK